ncbi:MAG: hypothetical protein ACERKZ_12165 [Lachnotalea sp.]
MKDKLVVVDSPQNPYCEKEKITVDDLRKLSFVVHKTDSQRIYKMVTIHY